MIEHIKLVKNIEFLSEKQFQSAEVMEEYYSQNLEKNGYKYTCSLKEGGLLKSFRKMLVEMGFSDVNDYGCCDYVHFFIKCDHNERSKIVHALLAL